MKVWTSSLRGYSFYSHKITFIVPGSVCLFCSVFNLMSWAFQRMSKRGLNAWLALWQSKRTDSRFLTKALADPYPTVLCFRSDQHFFSGTVQYYRSVVEETRFMNWIGRQIWKERASQSRRNCINIHPLFELLPFYQYSTQFCLDTLSRYFFRYSILYSIHTVKSQLSSKMETLKKVCGVGLGGGGMAMYTAWWRERERERAFTLTWILLFI